MESTENIIYKLVADQKLNPQDAAVLLERLDAAEVSEEDDIAVIGMSCRLPKSNNVDEYWENLRNARSCVGRFPESRRQDAYDSPNKIPECEGDPFLIGGYLEDVDKFDAGFFRMSPQVAKWTEPCHRMFLIASWEAVEDAGYTEQEISGTNTGVYVGIDHTYKSYYGDNAKDRDFGSMTGTWTSILAGRVAYALNLHGPNVVVDTACSGGLVSIHMACNALNRGECEMAIVGGVNFLLAPSNNSNLEMVQSPDSMIKSFDRKANGTVWGEGIGSLLLKPLKRALADNDNIHAVIKGSAINNDGASGAITAPSAEAQEEVLVRAWEYADIEPETISYIEAHGTGTNLGDPIEIKGITKAFKRFTSKKQFCGIGSVKPNVGHLVGASGIASIIKVIMAMKHGELPPSINFNEPNPYINFQDSPVYVNDKLKKWETPGCPKRAGVSAFGFSGTNCHVVIEESPAVERKEDNRKIPRIVTLSARNQESLNKMAENYADYIERHKALDFKDICYTATTGRSHYNFRVAIIGEDSAGLVEKLRIAGKSDFTGMEDQGVYFGVLKIVKGTPESRLKDEVTEIEIQQNSEAASDKIKELLSAGNINSGIMEEICGLYVRGADIQWEELYKTEDVRRVSLPGCPLKLTRCWVEVDKSINDEQTRNKNVLMPGAHKLLGNCMVENMFDITYQNELSPESHWVLSDHKLIQRNVLPGTSYIEIARAACENYYNEDAIELKDVIFLQPMMFNQDETRELQTVLVKKEDGAVEFTICSRQDEQWVKHAEGKAFPLNSLNTERLNIEEIRSRCSTVVDPSSVKVKTEVSEFGPRWNNISEIFAGQDETLIKLELPEEFASDIKEMGLHPALLDNAVNLPIRMNDNKNYYLPFSYKNLKIYGRMPEKFYCHVKGNSLLSEGKETVSFDLQMCNESGEIFAKIQDYTIKKVHEEEFRAKRTKNYFEVAWIEKKLSGITAMENGSVLVFKDKKDIGLKVIERLKTAGRDVIEVELGAQYKKMSESSFIISGTEDDYAGLLAEVKDRGISQVVHLMTLAGKTDSMESLEESQKRGVLSLYYLIRALVTNRYNDFVDLILVSDCAYRVTGNETEIKPHNAAFFGLGKVVVQEYRNLVCRCVDIGDEADPDVIVQELAVKDREYIASYRGGARYIEEFKKKNLEFIPERKFEVQPEGVYIITGGAGGIGTEISKYLAARNKVNICLINRSPIPGKDKWDTILEDGIDKKLCDKLRAIRGIESTGSRVEYYSADVSVEDELDTVLKDIRNKFGRITGIFHCAGVAGDGFLIRKNEEEFKKVLKPKIMGAWLLDKLTRGDDPEIMVLFSSIYTLMGGPGQGDYCAANSYLDSFEAFRNKSGRRTLTINWPGWKETGMAFAFGITESSGVFKTIATADAINVFDEVINKDVTRVFTGEFDYEAISYIMDNIQVKFSDELKLLLNKKIKRLKSRTGQTANEAAYNAVVVGKDENELTELEKKVGQIWAHVLGFDEINVYETFQNMGGDSILAANLLKEMEKHFPGQVNISDIFTYTTVAEISKQLDKRLNNKVEKIEEEQENDIDKILEQLSKGDISADKATELLNNN